MKLLKSITMLFTEKRESNRRRGWTEEKARLSQSNGMEGVLHLGLCGSLIIYLREASILPPNLH